MDPRLIEYFTRELQHLREVGGEFATEFPKVAGRLGMDGFECADPYVERLLEGFAFMAARVQLKLDAQYPEFTAHLMEMVYPHYLAPTPSMTVVQIEPDAGEGSLSEGFTVPRDTPLRSQVGKTEQTSCEYRTTTGVTLWPLALTKASYAVDPSTLNLAPSRLLLGKCRAAMRFELTATAGHTLQDLSVDQLRVFLRGTDELPGRIYEQLLGNAIGVVVRPAQDATAWQHVLKATTIQSTGFTDDQAMLPNTARTFTGYRLLHEYFAFPQRYMFVDFTELVESVQRCVGTGLELIVLLDRQEPRLEHALDASQFALHCVPAINLFPRRADRIHLTGKAREYHVVPDRTRPLDFEVHSITQVTGHGGHADSARLFTPFYAHSHHTTHDDKGSHYALTRRPRMLSSKQRRRGPRSTYNGSEVFLSLVDARATPTGRDLKQLAVATLCTNRDLPIYMPIGKGHTDFSMEIGAPVRSIRCLAGPTAPATPAYGGEKAWRLISHLSLNYLSLLGDDNNDAAALRELLTLYSDIGDKSVARRIDAVQSISARAVTRRMPVRGPIAFGRGLAIELRCDDQGFEGTGAFLFGAVLERFFGKYASINSFTQTVLSTLSRGEIMRWPLRTGQQPTL